jgi:hypothetical protein
VLGLPPLGPLAVGLGIGFATWEAALVVSALWRVTRRHQVRHQFRVPVEIAGTMDGSVVRIADLTPDGAAILTARPLEIGRTVDLQMELPRLAGGSCTVRAELTVRTCHTEGGTSWRVGGTLGPRTAEDSRALIEHCHVVSSRARLTEQGRLEPGAATLTPPRPVPEYGHDQVGSDPSLGLVADG